MRRVSHHNLHCQGTGTVNKLYFNTASPRWDAHTNAVSPRRRQISISPLQTRFRGAINLQSAIKSIRQAFSEYCPITSTACPKRTTTKTSDCLPQQCTRKRCRSSVFRKPTETSSDPVCCNRFITTCAVPARRTKERSRQQNYIFQRIISPEVRLCQFEISGPRAFSRKDQTTWVAGRGSLWLVAGQLRSRSCPDTGYVTALHSHN